MWISRIKCEVYEIFLPYLLSFVQEGITFVVGYRENGKWSAP